MSEQPNLSEILGELNAGLFTSQVEEALKQVALAIISHDKKKKGLVVIRLGLERIGESSSVMIDAGLEFVKPTRNGSASEKARTSMPMYVTNLGYLTINKQIDADIATDKGALNKVTSLGGRNRG